MSFFVRLSRLPRLVRGAARSPFFQLQIRQTRESLFRIMARPVALLALLAFPACVLAQTTATCSVVPAGTEYSSTTTITTPNNLNGFSQTGPADPATPYPSTITVPGTVTGTVTGIQVQLNSISAPGNNSNSALNGIEVVLVHGTETMQLMGDVGDTIANNSDYNISGLNILIGNGTGFSNAPNATPNDPNTGTVCWTPSVYYTSGEFTGASALPSGDNIQYPQTSGSTTLPGPFNGSPAAGDWSLYVIDDFGNPDTIDGWNLYLTVNNTAVGTNTAISSNLNPSYATSPSNVPVFTATVTSTGGAPTGTVTFSANGTTIAGCPAVALSSSGNSSTAVCTTTLTSQGLNTIEAVYNPSGNFSTSNSTITQLVEAHAVENPTNTFCNTGSISIPDGQIPMVYPSVLNVSGVSGTVGNLAVELNGVTVTQQNGGPNDQFLLVAPDGGTYNLDILDDAFEDTSVSDASFTVADTGVSPYDTPATNGDTYLPYDGNIYQAPPEVWNDVWPSPTATSFDSKMPGLPSTINRPQGLASVRTYSPFTMESAFNGATPNGEWALYVYGNDAMTLSGWCIDFTELNTGAATNTSVSSSQQKATTGQSVTITATVLSGGNPVTSGSVTFVDTTASPEVTLASDVAVGGNGQASFSTSTLAEGDHDIQATYSGVPSTYNGSSGSIWQRVDDATTVAAVNATTWQFCNPGAVAVPAGVEGAATPNPSNIFVTNFPGTMKIVQVELNNFSIYQETPPYLASLIEGPSGAALDFFSNTGGLGAEQADPGSYVFFDTASALVPDSEGNLTAGSYMPTSYLPSYASKDTFDSSQSGFYNAPATFNVAGPNGSASFESTFPDNSNPNGTWSLFFNQHITSGAADGAANGWCVQLTENPPEVSVVLPSTQTFTAGQQGASFTVEVTNNGPGSTGDPTGGNAPLTFTDSLPTGLTYSNYSGTGWACSATGQAVTCTNDNSVADGSEYPELTIDVNVSPSAPGSLTNGPATVSGAGVASTNSNSDAIAVFPPSPPSIAAAFGATTVAVGATTSLTFTITNPNTELVLTGVAFSAQSPTFPSPIKVTGGTSSACGGTLTITASTGEIALSGASVTNGSPCVIPVTVTGAAAGGANYLSTSVTSANGGTGNVAAASISVLANPSISASFSSNPITQGNTSPLTIVVTNTNDVSLTGVSFADTLPSGLLVATPNALTSTCGGTATATPGSSSITLSGGTVAESNTCQVQVTVDGAEAGIYSDQAGPVSSTNGGTGNTATAPLTVNSPLAATSVTVTGYPSPDYAGVAHTATVNVLDQNNNLLSTYSGTAAITTSDNAATITPNPVTITNGTATFSVTFNTPGPSQSITATITGPISGSQTGIVVDPVPGFVVTTATDDATGNAANCPVGGGGADCSLRDALAAAASAGEGSITFSSTDFASPTTITLGSGGTLIVPSGTTITGTTTGSGATLTNLVTVSGAKTYTVFSVPPGLNRATLSHLIISNGYGSSGGGILNESNLTVSNCIVSNNTADNGGGIFGFLYDNGEIPSSLTVIDSTISGNAAQEYAGGIYADNVTTTVTGSTISNNNAEVGGGIDGEASLSVADSSIINNMAETSGGGIANAQNSNASISLTESTLSGNATTFNEGGGGAISSIGALTVTGSTISGNSIGAPPATAGGIYNFGTLNLANSIVAGNSGSFADIRNAGTYNQNGGNFANTSSSPTVVAAGLAPLGNYGGSTQTMLPLPGSNAICAGVVGNIPNGVTTDQRGQPNTNTSYTNYTSGTACVDAGAVQTNYSLSFSTEPEPITPASSILTSTNFQAGVTLNESGSPFSAASQAIPLTLTGAGTLTGGSASTTSGVATYSTLQVDTAGTGDTLTANLTLNSGASPVAAISTASTSFDVNAPAASTTTTGANATATFSESPQTVTLNATVTSTATVNSGTVTFSVFNGGTQVGSPTAPASVNSGSASALYTLPASTSAITYTIEASYSGVAGTFTSSSDNSHTLNVNPAGTSTVVSSQTANYSASSQNVTLSATVTSSAGTVNEGTVTFTVLNSSNATVGTATASTTVSGGNASVSYTLPAGTPATSYTIKAVYNGDSNLTTSNNTNTLTISAPLVATSVVVSGYPSPDYVGVPHTATVTVEDQNGNLLSTYSGTATITSSDGAAVITTTPVTITNGTGTVSVTLNTTGSQSITAAIPTLTSVPESDIQVNSTPGIVVTTATDDATANPADCPGASCSLRDAITAADTAGTGNITFDPTVFATPQTITLGSALPALTGNITITGPTTGTGLTLANLVTVSGNNLYQVFNVNSGAVAALENLVIVNGNGGGANSGAIENNGTLTVTRSTIASSISSSIYAGSIYNGGTLTITQSLIDGSVSDAFRGGGIYNQGSLTLVSSTLTGNSTADGQGGGLYNDSGTANLTNDTITNNFGATGGGGVYVAGGSVNLFNTIVSGNRGLSNTDIVGSYTDKGGNLIGNVSNLSSLGNNGGPTQSLIPLPGSNAICAGLLANIPNGVTTDQRGDPNTNSTYTGYVSPACVDAGAVQTNYSLSFSTEPEPITPANSILTNTNFEAGVTLDESGAPFTAASETIPLTLTGSGTLTGGSTNTSSGVATYSTLQVSADGTGDTLTAGLALNPSANPAPSVSVVSNGFDVGSPVSPSLSVTVTNAGTFSQGGQSGILEITVTNTAVGSTTGSNSITVQGVLPSGTNNGSSWNYALLSNSGAGWSCGGPGGSCLYSGPVTGGNSTSTLMITVQVPTTSPAVVPYSVSAYGGGDPVHSSSGTAAMSNTDNISVTQVPASVGITAGGTESAAINSTFTTPLTVLVTDAAGVGIPNQPVTFTAPPSGASGTFSNSTNTITANTASTGTVGQLAEIFMANGTTGSGYQVTAQAGTVSASPPFLLTNTAAVVTGSTSITETGLLYSALLANPVSPGSPGGGTTTFTVTNTSGSAITGPIQLVLTALPAGVTGANNAGTYNGSPYWTATSSNLAAGASVSVTVQLNYSASTAVSTTPVLEMGSL